MRDPRRTMSGHTRGALEIAIAAVSLGTLGPVASVAYETGIAPTTFSALRAAIGAGILGAIVALRWQPSTRLRSLPRREQTMLAAAVTVNGLQNLFLFLAYGEMAVALVLILFWLNPAMVGVASAALGRDRLDGTRVAALAVATFGLVLVLGSELSPEAQATPTGVALALAAAVCHAAYYLIVREGFPHVPAVQATSLVLAGGLVISGTVAIVTEGAGLFESWVSSPQAWAAILVVATIGAAFPKVLVIRGVRVIGSTNASLVALIEPVTGVVVATLWLGQPLTPAEIVGGAAILGAAAVVQRRGHAQETAPAAIEGIPAAD